MFPPGRAVSSCVPSGVDEMVTFPAFLSSALSAAACAACASDAAMSASIFACMDASAPDGL